MPYPRSEGKKKQSVDTALVLDGCGVGTLEAARIPFPHLLFDSVGVAAAAAAAAAVVLVVI